MKTYVLSTEEFLVLAAKEGVETCALLSAENMHPLSRRESVEVVFGLAQKGLIDVSCDQYTAVPEMQELFAVIRNSAKILHISYADKSAPPHCMYLSGDAVVDMTPAGIGSDLFRFCVGERKNLPELLEEDGQLPEETIAEENRETGLPEDAGNTDLKDPELLFRDSTCILAADVEDMRTALIYERVCVRRTGICYEITDTVFTAEGNRGRTFPYGRERLGKLLNRMTGEKKDGTD